jgi:hypothetical protein
MRILLSIICLSASLLLFMYAGDFKGFKGFKGSDSIYFVFNKSIESAPLN